MAGGSLFDNLLRGGLRSTINSAGDLASHFGDDAVDSLRQALRTTDDPQKTFNDWMASEVDKIDEGTAAREAAEQAARQFSGNRLVTNYITGISDTSRYLDQVDEILSSNLDQATVTQRLEEARNAFIQSSRGSGSNISISQMREINNTVNYAATFRRSEIDRIASQQGISVDEARAVFLQRETAEQTARSAPTGRDGETVISLDGEGGPQRFDPDADTGNGVTIDNDTGEVFDSNAPRLDDGSGGDAPPPRDVDGEGFANDADGPDGPDGPNGNRGGGDGGDPPGGDGPNPNAGGGGGNRRNPAARNIPFEGDPDYVAPTSVIGAPRRNIFQQAARLHYSNWGIPYTNISLKNILRYIPGMTEIGNLAKTTPNLFVASRYIKPFVNDIDASIKASGVIDAAKNMETGLADIAADLSGSRITRDEALDRVRGMFDEFAEENADNLEQLRENLQIRIKELESRELITETPLKFARGIEDLSGRQRDSMLKYLQDLDSMAASMQRGSTDNAILNDFVTEMGRHTNDGQAANALRHGGFDRFRRLGSDVEMRLYNGDAFTRNGVDVPAQAIEDVRALERSLNVGTYQRNTRYTYAPRTESNNAEIEMGQLMEFFEGKERMSDGRIKWDVEDFRAVIGHADALYQAGYPHEASRAVQISLMYMGRRGDATIPNSVLDEVSNRIGRETDMHKQEFLEDLRRALNDKPHNPLRFGPRDTQQSFADIYKYFAYGKAFPGEDTRMGFMRNFGDPEGVPGRVNRDRFIANTLRRTAAYFMGGTTEVKKAGSIGELDVEKLSWSNLADSRMPKVIAAPVYGAGRVLRDGVLNPTKFVLSGGLLGRGGPIGIATSGNTWSPSAHTRWAVVGSGLVGGTYYGGSQLYEAVTGDDVENNDLGNLAGFALGVPDIIASTGTNAIDLLLPGSPLNSGYESLIGQHIGFGSFMGDGTDEEPAADDTTTPAPDTTTPAPDTTTPAPDTTTPAPDTTTPAPDTTTPAPDTTTPAPDTTTPAPGTTTPAPGTTTPAPDTTTPAPSTMAPSTALPAGQTDAIAQQRSAAEAAFASIRADNGFVNSSVTNPGSLAGDDPERFGAVEMIQTMQNGQDQLNVLIDELIEEGHTTRAENLYLLRDMIQDGINESNGMLTQLQSIQRETQALMEQAEAARVAFTQLDPADRSAANVDEANRLVRRLDRIQNQISDRREAASEIRDTINSHREEHVALLHGDPANPDRNGNQEFQFRYGWRNSVNEGLTAAGGEYGILNQYLGTDRPGGTSVVGGYAQAVGGWFQGVGEWWQRTKANAKTQDQRNFYNLVETGGLVIGGMVAINAIDSLLGNKTPRAVKIGLMIALVGYALKRSGTIGQEMRGQAEGRIGRTRELGSNGYASSGGYVRQSSTPGTGGASHTPAGDGSQTALITDRNGNQVDHVVMRGTSIIDGRTQSHVGGMPIGGDEIVVGDRERTIINDAVLGRARMMGMGNNLVDDARRGTVDAVIASSDGQAQQRMKIDFTIGDAREIEAEMATAQ